jgi:hypothetical protein
VVDGRLVPNATEQAVIERMKSMRANGATYRENGGEVGHVRSERAAHPRSRLIVEKMAAGTLPPTWGLGEKFREKQSGF